MKHYEKIIFILLFNFFLGGCEETNIFTYTNKNLIKFKKDTIHYVPSGFIHVWNGYKKWECVQGNLFNTDNYYKLIFRSNHGDYATKYAYAAKYLEDYKNIYYCVSIYQNDDTENILKVLKYHLGNEFNTFFDSNKNEWNIFSSNKIYFYYKPFNILFTHIPSVLLCKKKQYEEYMKNHPNITVMQY